METYQQKHLNNIAENIALNALNVKAIKLNPEKPFLWASGYWMPIYNDNRLHLFHPDNRTEIMHGFKYLLKIHNEYEPMDVIAGTTTAGIAPGAILAQETVSPFIYVRDKPKDHGMKNQIEAIPDDQDLDGRTVRLVEDLVSTGGSSVKAVAAIRRANGVCNTCISIFSYDFDVAKDMFAGKTPYDSEGNKLDHECKLYPLLTYRQLLTVALKHNYLTKDQVKLLEEWREDPFKWGENHGFPREKK